MKRSKNWYFSKGVNPWFWSKYGHFSNFFLGNIGQENVFYDIVEQKKRLSRLSKQEVQKIEKCTFFQRGKPMVLVQKWPFFQLFFFGNIGQENVFYDMLERKNAFLGYKNKKFKRLKNGHFFKVVNPWFWSKNGHFFNFLFLGNIGQENVFYDILELKNAFRGYKNRKVKKSKNWLWVNPKMAIVPSFFFFREYRLGKCLWRYARTKKRFSRL